MTPYCPAGDKIPHFWGFCRGWSGILFVVGGAVVGGALVGATALPPDEVTVVVTAEAGTDPDVTCPATCALRTTRTIRRFGIFVGVGLEISVVSVGIGVTVFTRNELRNTACFTNGPQLMTPIISTAFTNAIAINCFNVFIEMKSLQMIYVFFEFLTHTADHSTCASWLVVHTTTRAFQGLQIHRSRCDLR